MSALAKFLSDHKRAATSPHSHTWFGKRTQTLSIPSTNVPKLHKLLLQDAQTTPLALSESPRCVTEKVTRGRPFRFFADLDFSAKHLLKWKQDLGLDRDFPSRLQQKLCSLVQLYQQVVATATNSQDVEMIVTTRLPYKIHLHFPSIIVDTDGAKAIASKFNSRFQDEHGDLYEETVSDTSVYTTGLRMLYCHKGSMAKPDKVEAERIEHQRLFPDVPYCDVYYITDVKTWTQNTVPSLADLSSTSIQAAKDAVLTVLATRGGKRKGREITRSLEARGKGKVRCGTKPVATEDSSLVDASQVLLRFLAKESSIAQDEIQKDKWDMRGTSLIIPTRSRVCPIAKREHNGNQQYFVVTQDGAEQRCHDDQCTGSVRHQFQSSLVKAAVADFFDASSFGGSSSRDDESEIIELRTDDDRLSAFRGVITEPLGTKTESAKLNLATANEKMTPMGYWTCTLPQNRYCPVCRSTHDRAENFMQVSPLGHRGIGCNLRHGEFYPDPLSTIPAATINILFNNTINVNVNTTASVENRDFGSYDRFPSIHDDEDLNKLCYSSLSGRTRAVATYAYHLMAGEFIYHDRIWYKFTGKFWRQRPGPDILFDGQITGIYEQLRYHFKEEKQQKWLTQLINGELGNLSKRKVFIEDLERLILEEDDRHPLDEQSHLLGFQNKVFDAKTGLLRDHQKEDYLTTLLSYDLPDTLENECVTEIHQFFADIMPNERVRDFLWLMIALHLAGTNTHSIAMIWSGSGGNGKSALSSLLSKTFGRYFDKQSATYFTSERPSPENPSALMVSQRYKRCVVASEPESRKKCNTAFIKFITGNDEVQARGNHSNDYVSYRPRFLITMLCNEIPLFDGAEGEIRGLWRRLKIIKFKTEFTDHPTLPHHRLADPGLEAKMELWPPHFMLLLIQRYQQYLREGSRIFVPEEVERNIAEEQQENNPMDMWLEANLIVAPGKRVHVHRFQRAYLQWLDDWRAENPDSRRRLGNLPKSGFVDKLVNMGHIVSSLKDIQRDPVCCTSSSRYATGIDVRDYAPR